jgi:hypothetical protein
MQPVDANVKVITDVPDETPFVIPVVAPIVATEVFPLDQVPEPASDKLETDPEQIAVIPLIEGGDAFMVMAAVE